MRVLIIKDLAVTEELDSKAMASVHGGLRFAPIPSISFEHVSQNLQQQQEVSNVTGSGSAFQEGIFTKNTTTQSGNNNIYFGRP